MCLSDADEEAYSLIRPLGNQPYKTILCRQIWSVTAASTSCNKSISKTCTLIVVYVPTWDTDEAGASATWTAYLA